MTFIISPQEDLNGYLFYNYVYVNNIFLINAILQLHHFTCPNRSVKYEEKITIYKVCTIFNIKFTIGDKILHNYNVTTCIW